MVATEVTLIRRAASKGFWQSMQGSFRSLLSFTVAYAVVASIPVVGLAGQPPSRISGRVEDGRTFVLSGNTHPLAASSQDEGEAQPDLTFPITMHFRMSNAQQKQLEQLLRDQQDPGNSQYHRWLTPEQFGQRFGLSDADLNKITSWLANAGFSNIEVNRSRTAVTMSGTASIVQSAFQTSIHRYRRDGNLHYANASDPSLPRALQGMITGIHGLNDFHPRAPVIQRTVAQPKFTSNLTGLNFIAPEDFTTIYDVRALYSSGIDGTGQKIAIAGQTDIQLSDIEAFRAASGLPPNDPQVVLTGTDPGTSSSDLSEADLDIEWAGAVAPQATIVYVNSNDAFVSATYAINNNLAPVLSLSYGDCEANIPRTELNSLNSAFQQANAQGMTIVAAGGDTGAADCESAPSPRPRGPTVATHGLAVDFPSSSPYVTGMGGTELSEGGGSYWSPTNDSNNGSALSYIPEVVWNDTASVTELSASGGGKSILFQKPSWQQGTGVPNDGARDTPDIALAASSSHDGFLICNAGSCVNGFRNTDTTLNVVGGTSVAAPTFAGIVALLNQKVGGAQGNVNPKLYSIASYSIDAFHDITTGNNQVPCRQGSPDCPANGVLGYAAGPGYDQTTGLGSIDAYHLVSEWAGDFQLAVSPNTITVGRGAMGTATVQVASLGGFGGTVSFTCTVPSALTNTTCSIPGTVSGSGSVGLTISAASSAGVFSPFRFTGLSGPGRSAFPAAILIGLAVAVCYLLRPGRRMQLFSAGVALLGLVVMTSCGDGSSSSSSTVTQTFQSSSETGSVTITATSGILSHTATVSVTVP
ncbi:MAG: S53 family peptidase [Acidobacteriaceae bacterium]|nr:S53 family peptidase [Acidobacteriaceae bacterium]